MSKHLGRIAITMSRVFPYAHNRKGEPTNFEKKIRLGRKKHIIKGNYDMWAINAEKMMNGKYYLSVCQWEGKPYRSEYVELLKLNNAISVQRVRLRYVKDDDVVAASVDERELSEDEVMQLATNEGLSMKDFKCWFFGKEPQDGSAFDGVIIHLTDLRY